MDSQGKEEMLSQFKYVKPVPLGLEKIIRKRGVKSGSCVFGGLRESSDVDILFLLDRDDEELELLNDFYFRARLDTEFMRYVAEQYRDEDSEFLSVYVKCRFTKRPVNLLLFDVPEIYWTWVDATMIMKRAIKDARMKEAIKDKRKRVYFFEAIKETIRR